MGGALPLPPHPPAGLRHKGFCGRGQTTTLGRGPNDQLGTPRRVPGLSPGSEPTPRSVAWVLNPGDWCPLLDSYLDAGACSEVAALDVYAGEEEHGFEIDRVRDLVAQTKAQ
jgi:hypothetical protein